MRTVSNHFRDVINQGGPFYAYAEVTLANGTELTFDSQNDFYISGNKYDHSFTSAFPIGEAVCKTIDIGIDNHDNSYSADDFNGAVIALYTEIDGEYDTPERLLEGIFNVVEATSMNNIIEISAADNMIKAEKPILERVAGSRYLRSLLINLCRECGITLATSNFRNDHATAVGISPGTMTYRAAIGYVAQMAGGNALINENGELVIKSYTYVSDEPSEIISGGIIGDNLTDIISGSELGTQISDMVEGDSLATPLDYLILNYGDNTTKIAANDIIVTGVSFTSIANGVSNTIQYGSSGYIIDLKNPLILPEDADTIQVIGESIIGRRVRPFSGKYSPNPTIELMDNVYILDDKGNTYQSFISSNTFNYLGNSELANETQSTEKNKTAFSVNLQSGYTGTLSYKKGDGTNGTITVADGIISSVT